VNTFLHDWGLATITFLPLVGAVVMMAIPRANEQLQKVVALVASTAAFAVGIWILAEFDYDRAGVMQFEINRKWIEIIHSRFAMGVDGIALPLLILTVGIIPLCVIYSWNHIPSPGNAKAFLSLILILETGVIGSFVAHDLILFFVFFEIVLLPMYFLIGVWGGEQRQYAAIKFFLYTLFGSALMIVAFLALFWLSGANSFNMTELHNAARVPGALSHTAQILIFGGMFVGFAIKVPMFPFHTWLPDAHTQAPTVGSVILAALLLKLGTYGFIRIAIGIMPSYASHKWAPVIVVLSTVGIIYGALGCLAQSDMKRLIAFSSVAHMGFTMLGIATLTDFGMNAAVFGMVAHGLITGMLFFVAGSMKERYHTLELKRLGGLLISAPKMGWILGFCSMASLGLPGLAGFWGEFPAILATYNPAEGLSKTLFRTCMVIAALGTVFAAGYLLWMFQRTSFGTPSEEFADDPHITDVSRPEWFAWTPLLICIILFGFLPGLMFDVTNPAVKVIAAAAHIGG